MKVIKVADLVKYLEDNDLLIVSASEFQANKEIELNALRARLLRKKALCVSDIVKAKLLPYTSSQGVRHWIEKKLKKDVHYYQEVSGKKRIMILTDVVKDYMEII